MSDHILTPGEVMVLAMAKTDAIEFFSGKTDWQKTRDYYCPNCGWLKGVNVRQAERDEVCLYVCRTCDEVAEERLPF